MKEKNSCQLFDRGQKKTKKKKLKQEAKSKSKS